MAGGGESVIFKDGPNCRSLLETELLNIRQLAAGHVAAPLTLLAGWCVGDKRRCGWSAALLGRPE
jgi:hypothetical protein